MQRLNNDDVVAFLKSAPATVGEVAAKFAVTKQTSNRVLANLRKAGTVAVVSSRNKVGANGERVKGRPEFLYGVFAGEVVEAPTTEPVEETKVFSFDNKD
jgi:predicted ArsR family transcriptional regulator